MTARAPDSPVRPAHEIAIVGSDMLLAALPARPVQLSHALLAAGFSLVVPASWGDELLAEHTVRQMLSGDSRPQVYCACPRIRQRLLAAGDELAPHLLGLIPPPVAAARYLRKCWPDQVLRIVYIGGCEGADDPSIDERVSPAEMLARLDARGIEAVRLPVAFRDVIPPDRRRHWSLPGGCPTSEVLAKHAGDHQLRIVGAETYAQELVEGLLSGAPVLLDLAEALNCACAGRIEVHGVRASRGEVTALEPPRAPLPVLDSDIVVDLEYRPRLVLSRSPVVTRQVEPPAGEPSVLPMAPSAPVSPAVQVQLPSAGMAPVAEPPARPADDAPVASPRRPMAVTPPGIAVMAAREGRQPPPHTIVGVTPRQSLPPVVAPAAAPPPSIPPVHGLPRLARSRASVRVTRDDGAAIPRAFAAMRRTPVARTPDAPIVDDEVPMPGIVVQPEADTSVTTPVELVPDAAINGVTPDTPATEAAPAGPAEPAAETPVVVTAPVETPAPRPVQGIRIPPPKVTPIPPPPRPQPRRLRGLAASVALLFALIALVAAVFGF